MVPEEYVMRAILTLSIITIVLSSCGSGGNSHAVLLRPTIPGGIEVKVRIDSDWTLEPSGGTLKSKSSGAVLRIHVSDNEKTMFAQNAKLYEITLASKDQDQLATKFDGGHLKGIVTVRRNGKSYVREHWLQNKDYVLTSYATYATEKNFIQVDSLVKDVCQSLGMK